MRRHISVLMLAARGSIYKLLLLLAAMVAGEYALFSLALKKLAAAAETAAMAAGESLGQWRFESPWVLEDAFTNSHIHWVFAAGLIVLCAILVLNGSGGKCGYTLRRLSVSERTVGIWWAVYDMAALVIFWAAQVLFALLLCQVYLAKADPACVNAQTVFLAFYRQKFLHSLLPLAETSRWVCNGALWAGLAVTASCGTYRLRRGKKCAAVVVLAVITALSFSREMGGFGGDVALALIALVAAGAALGNLKGGEADAD